MTRLTKKEQTEKLLTAIKEKTNRKNVDLVIPLLKWMNKKIDLIVAADEFKASVILAKKENKQRPKPLQISRGEIWQCQLGQNIGSEQSESRPVLILQNDYSNSRSPNTIIAPLTGLEHRNNEKPVTSEKIDEARAKLKKTEVLLLPEEIKENENEKLAKPSILYCQNIKEISKERLEYRITHVHEDRWVDIDAAIAYSLGLSSISQPDG